MTSDLRVLRWRPAPRLRRLAVVGAVAVLAAVLTSDSALLVLATPPVVLLALTTRHGLSDELQASTDISTTRCVEGDVVELSLTVPSSVGDRVTAAVSLPDTVDAAYDGEVDRSAGSVTVRWSLVPRRWGRQPLGPIRLTLTGGGGCYLAHTTVELESVVVYPEAGALARAVAPQDLGAPLGEHASRAAGAGVEFRGVRPYAAGDRRRDVDWRSSARHGELLVREYAAERAFDLVLVLDTAGDPGPTGRSVLDLTVRAASGLSQSYLRSHDRVGLLTFGGRLRWLSPATGPRQLYQVHEALMDIRPNAAELDAGRVEYGLEWLPARLLPKRAFVAMLTPLLDERPLRAARVLVDRGFAPLVLDVLTSEPTPGSADAELAVRAWRLQRDAWRLELAAMGIPVLRWDGSADLTAPLIHAMRGREGVR